MLLQRRARGLRSSGRELSGVRDSAILPRFRQALGQTTLLAPHQRGVSHDPGIGVVTGQPHAHQATAALSGFTADREGRYIGTSPRLEVVLSGPARALIPSDAEVFRYDSLRFARWKWTVNVHLLPSGDLGESEPAKYCNPEHPQVKCLHYQLPPPSCQVKFTHHAYSGSSKRRYYLRRPTSLASAGSSRLRFIIPQCIASLRLLLKVLKNGAAWTSFRHFCQEAPDSIWELLDIWRELRMCGDEVVKYLLR
jgi:hypothetical protein